MGSFFIRGDLIVKVRVLHLLFLPLKSPQTKALVFIRLWLKYRENVSLKVNINVLERWPTFIAGYGGTSSSQLIFILPFVDYQSDPFSEVIYITIIDRYRRKRERLVDLAAAALIPTMWGPFKAYCYRSLLDGIEHTAMVKVSISSEYSPPSSVSYFCLVSNTNQF